MYPIKQRQWKSYPDIKKLDRRKHVECHPNDPDAFRIRRVEEGFAGDYHVWYEYWKPKKGINKVDSVWNDYIKSRIKRKK
jgi:hypothetical protein